MKDRLGLAFFTFAAVISILAAWEKSGILAWLAAFHNAVLAYLYANRKRTKQYDRQGLLLGIGAALLPFTAPYPNVMPFAFLAIGVLGYGLVLWSLLVLGKRFGIAPADRGLVIHGPYRFIRHPMYLGELTLRGALVAASSQPFASGLLFIVLVAIQVLRACREEQIIAGYRNYAQQVRFRLIPGVW